jgi:hypothetical protein
MNQPIGTFLFVAAILGNAVIIVAGLTLGLLVVLRRGMRSSMRRRQLALQHDSAFHHPDRIRTPLGEWLFMGGACAAVLVGLPVVLAALFQYLLPLLGRAWTN